MIMQDIRVLLSVRRFSLNGRQSEFYIRTFGWFLWRFFFFFSPFSFNFHLFFLSFIGYFFLETVAMET